MALGETAAQSAAQPDTLQSASPTFLRRSDARLSDLSFVHGLGDRGTRNVDVGAYWP
jgi:hypothetical protein